jgi:23S rRNA pseudouridine2605 synthase
VQARPKRWQAEPEAPVRLHKALADAGIGSRRDMETWIAEGRVTVNEQTAKVGDRVTSRDVIKVSGRRVYLRPSAEKRVRVLLYHKQEGEIVSRDDPKGRVSVFDQLPKIRGAKWVSVGRLDFNTEGLMIFTTSGELANRMMHPRFEVEREYAVRVLGELTPEMQQKLLQGIELEDGEARLESLVEAGGEGANRWWRAVILEGRYREVRRLFDAVGVKVSRLIRTRYGPIALPPQLKRGQKQELDERDVHALLKWAGLATPQKQVRAGRTASRNSPRSQTGNRKTRR